jgi:uncharacterized protein YlxP (DUF503 family)
MSMHVGILSIRLRLSDTESLKDKRQIIKSLVQTTRQKFNVSIAEIDDLDSFRRATVGVASIANDKRFLNEVLDKIVDTVESNPAVEVVGVEMDLD